MRHLLSWLILTSVCAQAGELIKVSDSLYRGGRPKSSQLTSLAGLGVKTVIDLQGGDLNNPDLRPVMKLFEPGESPKAIALESARVQKLGMGFYNFPLDSLDTVTAAEDRAIDQIVQLMGDPAHQPVFVHCEHGHDRTGLVVALYRIQHDGWNANDAYNEWVARGHSTLSQFFTWNLDVYFFLKAAGLRPAK